MDVDSLGPLAGVKVLDLSRVLAGPWATQALADLGADVLKIERPDGGDDTRSWGPPFTEDLQGRRSDAAYYFAANRSKRSLVVDFSSAQGVDLIRRLAARADVLVENFKVGGLAKLGLDYAALRTLNPRLVYCSITGFGQTGPYAARPGYDYLIQAMSGLMSVTGEAQGAPMKVGVAVSDLFAGLYALASILAALRHAERTGEGQHLDVALLDCQMAALANQAQSFLATGEAPRRLGNAHPSLTPYGPFETADQPVILAVGNDGQFQALCRVLGQPELAVDPRFSTNAARVAHREALEGLLRQALAARRAQDWSAALEAAGVPCGPINTIEQAFADPQVRARGLTHPVARGDGVRLEVQGFPVRFSRTPTRTPGAPPALGEAGEAALAAWLED